MAPDSTGGIPKPALIIGGIVVVGVATIVLFSATPDATVDDSESKPAQQVAAPQEVEESDDNSIVVTAPPEIIEANAEELTFLPNELEIKRGEKVNAALRDSPFKVGNKRLRNVSPLTDKEEHGEFIAPKFSPDGLQMILTRPGYLGVYLMPANGNGDPIKISDENSFHTKWTADGKIEVRGQDDVVRIYGTDGTLEETRSYSQQNEKLFAEKDVIMVRGEEGEAPVPLTGNEDRYFNPVASPDGDQLVYQGLHTGLYLSKSDGSEEPIYLGEGNNPVWLPEKNGFVYDVTQDDGHSIVDGDLFFLDQESGEVSNLTEDVEMIGQMPSISPDGNTVIFESDGAIYTGGIQ